MTFTIHGEPASKSNQRQAVTIGGKPRFIKSKKARNYVKSAEIQLAVLRSKGHIGSSPLEGDVIFTADIYYASRRPDLDESLILDVLQGWCYGNDRQVKVKHVFWHLDRADPRARISVEAL